MGKPLEKFLPESQIKRIKQITDRMMASELVEGFELEVLGKSKQPIFLEINATPIFKNGKVLGFQGIARDITDRKRTEEEIRKRLMKFKLEDGKVYLIEESSNSFSQEVLKDLLKVGYTGLIISRTFNPYYEKNYRDKLEFLWLSENGHQNAIKPSLKKIQQIIFGLQHKRIIYFDRLDYLISKRGFNRILTFVQNLIDFALFSNHIIILSLDPSTLDALELRLLEKETKEIEPIFKPNLPDDLINILRYVYEQNIIGLKPSYTEVESELSVCKPTMRKRIRKLISGGYLTEANKGRSKVIGLSERGRAIFQ